VGRPASHASGGPGAMLMVGLAVSRAGWGRSVRVSKLETRPYNDRSSRVVWHLREAVSDLPLIRRGAGPSTAGQASGGQAIALQAGSTMLTIRHACRSCRSSEASPGGTVAGGRRRLGGSRAGQAARGQHRRPRPGSNGRGPAFAAR